MTFSSQKIFKPKFKKVSLLIANCLINLFRKLNKNLKKLHSGNLKRTFYVNVKTIFDLHLPFAINFMFELNKSFKKVWYDSWSNMIILLYFDVFLVFKRPTNLKHLNKINLDILVTDDLGCLQGFFHVNQIKLRAPILCACCINSLKL